MCLCHEEKNFWYSLKITNNSHVKRWKIRLLNNFMLERIESSNRLMQYYNFMTGSDRVQIWIAVTKAQSIFNHSSIWSFLWLFLHSDPPAPWKQNCVDIWQYTAYNKIRFLIALLAIVLSLRERDLVLWLHPKEALFISSSLRIASLRWWGLIRVFCHAQRYQLAQEP